MMRVVRLCVVVVAALAAQAASASAISTIEFDPGGSISQASNGGLVFLSEGGLINPELTCPVTLRGTLQTGAFEAGPTAPIGEVTSVSVGECAGGTMSAQRLGWIWRKIGWLVQDRSRFIRLVDDAEELQEGDVVLKVLWKQLFSWWRVTVAGVTCEYEGDFAVESEVTHLGSNVYALGTLDVVEALTLRKVGGSLLCPPRAGFSGELAAFSPTQTIALS